MTNTLHSRVLGQGAPILILHGFLGMGDNWKTLGTRYAEQNFEVHLIDQRNHGKSFHSGTFDYDALCYDLERYMARKNLERAVLIGHSMGGKTAMQFACTHSEKVKKLVVADIAPKYYPPHHHTIINALNQLDFDNISSRKEADSALERFIFDFGTRQFLLKNLYWVEKKQLGLRFNLEVLSNKMEEIGENIGTAEIYDGPTLFLRGEKSEYVSNDDLTEIKRHFPLAELDTVEGAGHWLHAENPQQFFEKSLKFIQS